MAACVKSLESADQETRRSLSRLVGHILASTQTARAAPPPDAKKKKDKEQNEDDEDTVPSSVATTETMKTILTPSEMLSQLSTHFNKPNTPAKNSNWNLRFLCLSDIDARDRLRRGKLRDNCQAFLLRNCGTCSIGRGVPL